MNIATKLEQVWNQNSKWQGRRVNLYKNVTCPDYPDFNIHLNRRVAIAIGVFGANFLVHELLHQEFNN